MKNFKLNTWKSTKPTTRMKSKGSQQQSAAENCGWKEQMFKMNAFSVLN